MAKNKFYDGGMLNEDKSQVANMPQEVIYKSWERTYKESEGKLNDSLSGIDSRMDEDNKAMKKNNVPKKW